MLQNEMNRNFVLHSQADRELISPLTLKRIPSKPQQTD